MCTCEVSIHQPGGKVGATGSAAAADDCELVPWDFLALELLLEPTEVLLELLDTPPFPNKTCPTTINYTSSRSATLYSSNIYFSSLKKSIVNGNPIGLHDSNSNSNNNKPTFFTQHTATFPFKLVRTDSEGISHHRLLVVDSSENKG